MFTYTRQCFLLGSILVVSSPAAADPPTVEAQTRASWGQVSGQVGAGVLGPDPMAALGLGLDLREGRFALGLWADLYVKLADLGGPGEPGLRTQDWDEPSDWAHVIRYLSYWREASPVAFGLALGELTAETLADGSLMSRYVSVVDLDHGHSGAQILVSHSVFDLKLLTADFVSPTLLAGSLDLRPVPGHRNLTVSLSGALDARAPRDDGSHPVGGLTLGLQELVRLGRLEITPMVSASWQSLGGVGIQAGGRTRLHLRDVRVGLSASYRLAVGAFAFGYFDSFYDVQRTQFDLSGESQAVPKATVVAGLEATASGGAWGLELAWRNLLLLSAGYELRRPELGDACWLDLQVPYGRTLTAGLLVAKTGLRRSEDWKSASGLLLGLEAQGRLYRFLYFAVKLRYAYLTWNDGYRGALLAIAAVGAAWNYEG